MKKEDKYKSKSRFSWVLDAIDEQLVKEKTGSEKPRHYLGASLIGEECERKIWYDFRHAKEENWKSYNVKAIEEGYRSEDVMVERFQRAGFDLKNVSYDQDKPRQFGFKSLGGWFRGHKDGIIYNLKELGTVIWEAKATEKWLELNKLIVEYGEENALKHWNANYYTQAQIYMGESGIHHHLLTACNPGSTRTAIVYTPFNEAFYKKEKEKAKRIIKTDEPPFKAYPSEEHYKCKYMCNSVNTCWKNEPPKPNCRNCAHVEFDVENKDVENPIAKCQKHNSVFPTLDAMTQSYACHRYNPFFFQDCELVELKDNDLIYRNKETGVIFTNGESGFNSLQIYENRKTKPWLSKDINEIVDKFGASFIQEEVLNDSESETD